MVDLFPLVQDPDPAQDPEPEQGQVLDQDQSDTDSEAEPDPEQDRVLHQGQPGTDSDDEPEAEHGPGNEQMEVDDDEVIEHYDDIDYDFAPRDVISHNLREAAAENLQLKMKESNLD